MATSNNDSIKNNDSDGGDTGDANNCATDCFLPTFNPNNDTVNKKITKQLFDVSNRVTRQGAIDFNYRCNLGVNIRSGRDDGGEAILLNIIKRVRCIFDSHLRGMIEDTIKQECIKRGLKCGGQSITRMGQLADAWAADKTLAEKVWHCAFGVFYRKLDWENEFEMVAMEQLKYEYIDDDMDEVKGTNRRGNKGCIAKLATRVKREVVKLINRKTVKTHGIKVVAGTEPELISHYANGKPKYKKRTSASENFNFDPTRHLVHTKQVRTDCQTDH
jgi:hypothetical protein